MSEIDDNFWEDLSANYEIDYFHDWLSLENFLGESDKPGFENITRTMRWPKINEGLPLPLTFSCYRGEDGSLLAVFANYMMNDTIKPFILIVHPDHQRTGLGTLLANHVVTEYEITYDRQFPYKESWGDSPASESGANWANKYVRTEYQKQNTGGA
jgi:GNAT superfamily N-acetyltransferase